MILFRELAEVFQKLEQTSSNSTLVAILAAFLARLTPDEARAVAYLLRGEVGAPFESREIGMAERMVVRAVVDAYAVSQQRVEKLLAAAGDLGTVAEDLARAKQGRAISILHVFNELLKIAAISRKRLAKAKVREIDAIAFRSIEPRSKIHPAHSPRYPSHWRRRHDLFARLGESLHWQRGEQAQRRSRLQRPFGLRRGSRRMARSGLAGHRFPERRCA